MSTPSRATPSVTRAGQRPAGRPPIPKGAGINVIKLDNEITRDEVAATLDDLFATFNVRLQIRSHPVIATSVFLALTAAAAGITTLLARGRWR